MKDSLDTRYALALFSIAKENNRVQKYQQEIKDIKLLFLNNEDFMRVLKSEFISIEERYKVIDHVLKNNSIEVVNFIKLLIKRHRINSFTLIANTFNSLCNEERNVLEGIVYSTEPLDVSQIKSIEKALSKKNHLEVELTNRIDPSLIGGIKVVINHHIYDYSIASEIESMRTNLKA